MLASIHAWIYPDIQPVPEQTLGTQFYRLYSFNDELVPLILNQKNPGDSIEVHFAMQKADEAEIRQKIIQILGLDIHMSAALKKMKEDEQLLKIVPRIRGIQPYQSPSVFEALVKTIIQQQVSYRAANVLTRRMVLSLGYTRSFKNLILYSFPTAEEIAECSYQKLQSLGFGYKTEYIHSVAESVANGNLELEGLRGKGHLEVKDTLFPIRGIGQWTIRTLAIAGLGDFTLFPVGDLGIRNLLGRLFNNGVRMSVKEVETFTEQWGNEWPIVLYLLMCADVLGFFGSEGRQQTHKRHSNK